MIIDVAVALAAKNGKPPLGLETYLASGGAAAHSNATGYVHRTEQTSVTLQNLRGARALKCPSPSV